MGNTFIPLYARELGAPLSLAALTAALMFAGQALADLPGGYLVHRFGNKNLMLAGIILSIAALIFRIIVTNISVLVISVVLFGTGSSFIWISRMNWLKQTVRGKQRGYIMSFVGGSLRLGNIAGPLMGGFLAEQLGYNALFIGQAGIFTAALAAVLIFMPSEPADAAELRKKFIYRDSLKTAGQTWKLKRINILSAGTGIAMLTVLRTSREILFPLWGGVLGLSEWHVGLVVFAGALVDASLFWLSGIIMTRLGRKTAAVLCISGLTLALALLPAAHSMGGLLVFSMLAGLGNATGAGINLTVSGDLAPREHPEAFLSFWRFAMGLAGFGGPALASWIIAVTGLAGAPVLVLTAGLSGVFIMGFFMNKT